MKGIMQAFTLVLVLAILLSCAIPGTGARSPDNSKETRLSPQASPLSNTLTVSPEENKDDPTFAENEMVRVILFLKSAAVADYPEKKGKEAELRYSIEAEHRKVQEAMTAMDIDVEIIHEYSVLTNGFSCDVPYGRIKDIEQIPEVETVEIVPPYEEPTPEKKKETRMVSSNQMTGNALSHSSGFTGKGMVIAVLDTGLNIDHEAFQVYDGMEIEEVLNKDCISKTDGRGAYVNKKVPFVYNYVGHTTAVSESGDHGTMVAGICTGYAEDSTGKVIYCGSAPAAQLVAMKVSVLDSLIAALEDAYSLGVDIINYSSSSISGYTYDMDIRMKDLYQKLHNAGILVCASAGNNFNMGYLSSNSLLGTEHTDYGNIGSPSSIIGNVSVGSANNRSLFTCTMTVAGHEFPILSATENWFSKFAGKSVECVVVKNAEGTDLSFGEIEDYANLDVEGKIAVVSNGGDLPILKKTQYASVEGALGLIVCNQDIIDPTKGGTVSGFSSVILPSSAREIFLNAAEGIYAYTSAEKAYVEDTTGQAITDYSSWGPTPMLTIDPVILSVGHNVMAPSHENNTGYELGGGTSSSSPNMAGTLATILQGLKEQIPNSENLSKKQLSDLSLVLLESTAVLQRNRKGIYASVRQQGSGLANSFLALQAYEKGAYIANPIQELGHDKNKTGIYTLSLILNNEGSGDIVYDKLRSYVLYDTVEKDADGRLINTMESSYLYEGDSGKADITYRINGDEVTEISIKSGESITVEVTISLHKDIKEYFDSHYPNGNFIDGYICFSSTDKEEEELQIHGTFLAYYGDWNQAPALEQLNSFDYLQAAYEVYKGSEDQTLTEEDAEALIWQKLLKKAPLYTNINQAYVRRPDGSRGSYLGENPLDWKNTEFMPEHVAISTEISNGSSHDSIGLELDLFLLRNTRHLVMRVTDKHTGQLYFESDKEHIRKSIPDLTLLTFNRSCTFTWKGTKLSGNSYVPSGTEAVVSISAQLPYGEAGNEWQEKLWAFDVTVDYVAPVIEDIFYDQLTETLTVRAKDEGYLAGISLCNPAYQTVYCYKTFSSTTKGGSFEAVFDVSELPKSPICITAVDYATNETTTTFSFVEEGLPATILCSTPEEETTYAATTGDTFTFPAAPEYEGYVFLGWSEDRFTTQTEEKLPRLCKVGDTEWIGKIEYRFYAVYAKGEEMNSVFIRETPKSPEGTWAFVSFPDGKKSPVAMHHGNGNVLESIPISTIEDNKIYSEYSFSTDDTSILFTFMPYGDSFLLKDAGANRYMAYKNSLNSLNMEPELYGQSIWDIKFEDTLGKLRIKSSYFVNRSLFYNHNSGRFELIKDSTVTPEQLQKEIFELYAFRYYKTKLAAEYYTTDPCFYETDGNHSFVYTVQGDKHSGICCCGYTVTEPHSYVNGSCPCGLTQTDMPKITVNHTLNLQSDISINYVIPIVQLASFDRVYLDCFIPIYTDDECTGKRRVTLEGYDRNKTRYFTLDGITAIQMNDMIEAELHLLKNGEDFVITLKPYSVATYVYSILNNPAAGTTLQKLCVNLLRYGGKAQLFKGYRTDALAHQNLTQEHWDHLVALDTVPFQSVHKIINDCTAPSVSWAGQGLDLQSKVAVRFIADCSQFTGDVNSLYLQVTYVNHAGQTLTARVDNPTLYREDKKYYAFDFHELQAAELRTVLTAVICHEGTQVSHSLCYSADTYGNNKTGDLLTLCSALFAYSDCAKAYFGN